MICPKCGSGNIFNRHRYMLCLSCGHTFPREKTGPAVTTLQLQVQSLQAELQAANDKADTLGIALSRIATYTAKADVYLDFVTIRSIAREALGMEDQQ
jgi:transposase-like protein